MLPLLHKNIKTSATKAKTLTTEMYETAEQA